MNSDIFKYCGGPYGDRRLRSYNKDLPWRNEWEEIPSEEKEILIQWLNDDDIVGNNLHEVSLLASHCHPVVEYLVKEGQMSAPDVEGYAKNSSYNDPRRSTKPDAPEDWVYIECSNSKPFSEVQIAKNKTDGIVVMEHRDAEPFMEIFLSYRRKYNLRKILNSTKLQIGFAVDEISEYHMIKFATLNYIWRLPSEKELEEDQRSQMMESRHKSDEHLDKIFRTTHDHSWGEGWAGILELNTSKVSTNMGGTRHAVAMPRQRYRIRWINLTTREPKELVYESGDISQMMESVQIVETNGCEKAPSIYPTNRYEYDTKPEGWSAEGDSDE